MGTFFLIAPVLMHLFNYSKRQVRVVYELYWSLSRACSWILRFRHQLIMKVLPAKVCNFSREYKRQKSFYKNTQGEFHVDRIDNYMLRFLFIQFIQLPSVACVIMQKVKAPLGGFEIQFRYVVAHFAESKLFKDTHIGRLHRPYLRKHTQQSA